MNRYDNWLVGAELDALLPGKAYSFNLFNNETPYEGYEVEDDLETMYHIVSDDVTQRVHELQANNLHSTVLTAYLDSAEQPYLTVLSFSKSPSEKSLNPVSYHSMLQERPPRQPRVLKRSAV
jgi:hypothetical protein